jgi:hypothetical protein
MSDLCTQQHICMKCKKPCLCNTYPWACPWINDDEDKMCEPCLDEFAQEYQEWYDKP